MTPTHADPIAAEAREIAGNLELDWPTRARIAQEIAAFGYRMKSAGRAEASAWRPISDEQPRDKILVWDDGTLSSDPGVKVWRAGSQKITTPGITHWMPLPPPPEGGER